VINETKSVGGYCAEWRGCSQMGSLDAVVAWVPVQVDEKERGKKKKAARTL